MAATGFTPISLYYSATPTNVPLAADLVAGELALNTADGKLYFKNSSGVVTLLAGAGGTGIVAGSNTYVQYNNSGVFGASSSFTFDGSTLKVGSSAVLGGTTNPIIAATGSSVNYIQQYIYNSTNGTSSSADVVAYANNSTDASGWADMGFTSQTFADATYSVTGPNEAYLFGSAPSGAGATGNLVFATDSTGSANSFQWYVGGFNQAKSAWKMQLTTTGLQLANALSVSNGGTGATTLTGILKGNGTSAFTAATAGTDYVAPGTATTYTALQTFTGTSSNAALKVTNIKEVATVSATAATGTINFDATTQSVLYYTSNASANWTINFRASSGTALDAIMSTGESMSFTHLVTQGATAYYNSSVQIDGTTSGVTTKWQGSAPTSGNASAIDSYTYVIIKTSSATFTVLASQTKFA